jgi:hypothetical protein
MGLRFILVHSPLTGHGVWEPVARELMVAGHEAAVAGLRDDGGAGGEPYWRQQVRAIAGCGSPVAGSVLVAHSGAGALLGLVAQATGTQPAGYVFVDAGLPVVEGGSRLDEAGAFAGWLRAHLESGGRFPEWTDDALAPAVPGAEARRELLAGLRPRGLDFFEERLPPCPGWPDAPCAYLQFSAAYDDRARRAQALGWPYRRLDAGHFHMLVDPAAVAEALAELAAALRP